MNTPTPTRKPRRRIIRNRTWDSRFKVGQHVTADGDSNGDYHGRVVKTHRNLTLTTHTGEQRTLPGVTIEVTRWEGIDYNGAPDTAFAPFLINAHDKDTRRRI
jgi:hypothetical protein